MKSVVFLAPDERELAESERQADSFVLDPETYYYFWDQVFLQGIQKYIKQRYPREIPPGKVINGLYHSPPIHGVKLDFTPPAGSPAVKAAQWFDLQDVIVRHYKEWRRREPRFYVHKGKVYSFVFHGFWNVGAQIEVLLWEAEDLVAVLDQASRHPIRWTLKTIFQ